MLTLWLALALADEPVSDVAGPGAGPEVGGETGPVAEDVAEGVQDDPPAPSPRSKWTWRAAIGAEGDINPHGVFDLGGRLGDLTLELQTLAFDVRWQPSRDKGRWWVGARVEPLAAGLFFSRLQDGRVAPEISYGAFMEGIDGGGVAYLPHGFYVGGQAFVQLWQFLATPATTVEVPGLQAVVRADAVVGYYRPEVHVWVRAGSDWSQRFSPHVQGQLTTDLPWIVRPRVEIRAGWADFTNDLIKQRLGGLNPYVIPLAGASWAEFWVEDYAAFRAGPEVGQERWRASLVADAAWFDGTWAFGFAASGRYEDRGRWVEAALGWAPWLPRDPGVPALAGWLRLGIDWGHGWGPRS